MCKASRSLCSRQTQQVETLVQPELSADPRSRWVAARPPLADLTQNFQITKRQEFPSCSCGQTCGTCARFGPGARRVGVPN